VDLAEATVAFKASKTGAVVALPIMPPPLEALMDLPAGDCPDAPLFPGVAAMPVGSRSNAFRKLLCGVGLATDSHAPTGRAKGRRVTAPLSFHSLRHSNNPVSRFHHQTLTHRCHIARTRRRKWI
jgi:hypothetical protein